MEKKYNFKEFKSFGSRTATNYIGITRNGMISFYSGFCERNNLRRFTKCVLLYDKQQQVIGIQFGGDELGKKAYPVNFDDERKLGWISSTNVFRLNPELDLAHLKGKYEPEEYFDESRKNVFVIDLNKKVQ